MRFLKSEAGAIVLWLAASLFAAALLTPYLYDAGKTLAHNASVKDYPGVIEWLAASCGRADLDRYFSRALLISGLALLPSLIRRVKNIPRNENADRFALRKLKRSERLLHLIFGLLVGCCTLGALGLFLGATGAAVVKESGISSEFFSKAFLPALGAGVIEELVFRGLILGLWLRACSLWTAWIGSSLMFSFVHFLKPPPGSEIADPRAWESGFEILGSTLGHFTDPAFFVTEFATLAFLGLLLAYCRTRTFSLWLPIGIHAGLVFALKIFSMLMRLDPGSPLHPWFIGTDLKSGILPIVALGVCFGLCVAFVRRFPPSTSETNPPRTQ